MKRKKKNIGDIFAEYFIKRINSLNVVRYLGRIVFYADIQFYMKYEAFNF